MPFSCQDSVVSFGTSGWDVCHRVPQSGVGVVNLGIRPVLVPPRLYRCRHGPCARKVEPIDSCSCRGNDETSSTNNSLRIHRCWVLVIRAECDGTGRNNATLRCKRTVLAHNYQRILRGLDSAKIPLSNVGRVSVWDPCSIWHTWGTRWVDMLLHPRQRRPKSIWKWRRRPDTRFSIHEYHAFYRLLLLFAFKK